VRNIQVGKGHTTNSGKKLKGEEERKYFHLNRARIGPNMGKKKLVRRISTFHRVKLMNSKARS
jgi:hypothetical protein